MIVSIDPSTVTALLNSYRDGLYTPMAGLDMTPVEMAEYGGTLAEIFNRAMSSQSREMSARTLHRMCLVKFVVAFEQEFM